MPGMYGEHYDLVGCIVGVVERDGMVGGEAIRPGDAVVALASTGLHTNGYSLARRALFEDLGVGVDDTPSALGGETVGEALLHPHRCYWPAIRAALAAELPLHGMAHITGGGWYDNLPRVLPAGLGATLRTGSLPVPGVMRLIAESANLSQHELYRVFNMGVGMMWVLPEAAVDEAVALVQEHGCDAARIGCIQEGAGIRIAGIDA